MALAHRRPYGMYRWLAKLPRWFYQLGLGWFLGHRVAQITHRGRKSGQIRRTILEVLHYDPQTQEVLVVSGWEGKTDWYRNIKQAGECTIQWQGRRYLAEIPERMDATQAFPLFTPAWRLALRFAGIRQFVKLTSA